MNDVLLQILSDFRKGKLSHAVLIEGGQEQEREQAAFETAKAIVCTGSSKPCGVCSGCIKASARAHPDILYYAGGTSIGSFKVDTVREIRQQAGVLPNESEQKVFILHNAHGMTPAAQNALLKILEEPPRSVRFVLTCDGRDQLLQTILSRVSIYSIPSDGVQGDSEMLAAADDLAEKILLSVAAQNEMQGLCLTAAFERDKTLFGLCCACMYSLCAQAMLSRYSASEDISETAADLGSRISGEQLLQIQKLCADTSDDLQNNVNFNLLITYFNARLFCGRDGRI